MRAVFDHISQGIMNKKIAIVIPARYASTRFEGKPLALLDGKTMLEHTCDTALKAASQLVDIQVIVATDDQRILDKTNTIDGITAVMTHDSCISGSDRVLSAIDNLAITPNIVVNLQGDAPFTPVTFITSIVNALSNDSSYCVATPVVQLSWDELDQLRENKKITPFSGTTAILNKDNQAIWFSKNILPAIRKEETLRKKETLSPVYQHIGLYAFKLDALRQFVSFPESPYEKLEGLEQLRLLENGLSIHAEIVNHDKAGITSGIDTPEDLARAEKFIKQMRKENKC
jgi:3-deoxy-manno-octulosonate cytidylyltransferase (CMP-KDO synthetase)